MALEPCNYLQGSSQRISYQEERRKPEFNRSFLSCTPKNLGRKSDRPGRGQSIITKVLVFKESNHSDLKRVNI